MKTLYGTRRIKGKAGIVGEVARLQLSLHAGLNNNLMILNLCIRTNCLISRNHKIPQAKSQKIKETQNNKKSKRIAQRRINMAKKIKH